MLFYCTFQANLIKIYRLIFEKLISKNIRKCLYDDKKFTSRMNLSESKMTTRYKTSTVFHHQKNIHTFAE